MPNKDVIERQYLRRKLRRDMKAGQRGPTIRYIEGLLDWLKGSVKRTRRPGGLGR